MLAAGDQQLRGQQLALLLQVAGQVGTDARQRAFGVGGQATLPADLGQEVPGAVAHRGRRALFGQAGEDVFGVAVQAVGQQQAAAQGLGLVAVRRQAVEVLRHHQRGDGLEVLGLVEVEQRVAPMRRADLAGAGERGGHEGSEADQGFHCQTLTSNSGCSLACLSWMRSSMYLASVDFSNLTVAPRR